MKKDIANSIDELINEHALWLKKIGRYIYKTRLCFNGQKRRVTVIIYLSKPKKVKKT